MIATEKQIARFVSVPLEIFSRVDLPIQALVYGYIQGWEVATNRSKVYLDRGCQRMAQDLNVSVDTIQRSCNRLVELKLLFKQRTPYGLWYSTKIDVIESDTAICGITKREMPQIAVSKEMPQIAVSNINTPLKYSQDSSKDSNESLSSSHVVENRLPNPALHKPKLVKPVSVVARLTETQRDLATQFLGITCEDNKAPLLFTQEQVDRDGFVEEVLKKCIDASKRLRMTSRTGYLISTRDALWNAGRYVSARNVQQAVREEKQKRKEESRKRFAEMWEKA